MPDDVPHALRSFTPGCITLELVVKGNYVTSHWRPRRSIWGWFWTYFAVNYISSRSGGSYGNSSLVICCQTGTSLKLRSRPCAGQKSLGCCCRNCFPTVINHLNRVHRRVIMLHVSDRGPGSRQKPSGHKRPMKQSGHITNYKNGERHRAHTIVSWSNPKRWVILPIWWW